MNRVRIGAAITIILGVIFAFAGLMESLTQFGIGLAVAAFGVILYGYCDFADAIRDEKLAQHRAEVWHRRDLEARNANRVNNIYEYPRDGWY